MTSSEYSGSGSKKGRGMARRSLDLIEAMAEIAEAAKPITGRGVGYKLFTAGLIPSMSKNDMRKVYRLLTVAREQELISWDCIVDETRELEICSSWKDPAAFVRTVSRAYRRDFWDQQPLRVEVWSEKGTVRGVLQPVLDQYGVGFRVMHGFGSATSAYDIAQDGDGRLLIALYALSPSVTPNVVPDGKVRAISPPLAPVSGHTCVTHHGERTHLSHHGLRWHLITRRAA